VEVVGNQRRPAGAIIAESGLALGSNIFSADLDSARRAILSDPWIAEAVLSRRLPGTISVRVSERAPAALVAMGDVFLVGADGKPFKTLDVGDPVDLPLITGIRGETSEDERESAATAVRRGIDLAAEYAQSPLAKRAPLEEVHVDEDGSFTLVVDRTPVELSLGLPPFRRKLDQAARVVAELDRRHARAKVILLDNSARPERVVVRLR
jgi:cell division protein FtsQ